MINELKTSLWYQFGASIDMLENLIELCPDTYLKENRKFFYITFHCLVFLDYYMTIPPKDFSPMLPFTFTDPEDIPEGAIDDLIPDKLYTKPELLEYVRASRKKARSLISNLTEERLSVRFREDFEEDAMDYSLLEILLYDMRHVQHHVGQLNMLLRNGIGDAPRWVFGAGEE